jgi:hypothetical protein
MTNNQDERKHADAPALEVVAIADFDSLMWIPPFGHGMNTVRGKLVTIRSAQAAVAALQARLNQQSALVEKCMVAMNENADRGQEAQQRIAELEAEVEALRKDAGRYQWLLQHIYSTHHGDDTNICMTTIWVDDMLCDNTQDSIDAAMKGGA